MAEPTKKHPGIEALLSTLAGASRSATIRSDRCMPKPIGCGEAATEFRDELSQREYTISGLCQACQDRVFGGGDDE